VAALDLEIRGAGNLLGGEQSGHMESVGFEMYTKLLEETVRELKGEDIEDDLRATVNLRVDLKIDEGYIPDMNQRLMVYRRIASARTEQDLERAVEEVRDRYGPLPTTILNLADYGRIRVMADRLGVETVDREGDRVVFRFRPQTRLDPAQLVNFIQRRADVTLVPPSGLRLDLKQGATGAMGASGAFRCHRLATEALRARETCGTATIGASLLVDGSGNGRGGHLRLHQGRDPQAGGTRPSRPHGRLYSSGGPVGRAPRVSAKILVSKGLKVRSMSQYARRLLPGILVAVALCTARPSAEIIEQILVKVNGEILTKTDLEQRQVQALRAKGLQPADDAALKKAIEEVTPQIVADAIDEMLLTQQGKELGYKLSDEEFDRIVASIRKENKLDTDEAFQAALKQEGMTLSDLRKSMEKNMLISRVTQNQVMSKVGINEEEARKYHASHLKDFHHAGHGNDPRDPRARGDRQQEQRGRRGRQGQG
jgi:hypothetical protein